MTTTDGQLASDLGLDFMPTSGGQDSPISDGAQEVREPAISKKSKLQALRKLLQDQPLHPI